MKQTARGIKTNMTREKKKQQENERQKPHEAQNRHEATTNKSRVKPPTKPGREPRTNLLPPN
jgi:hypothetical protein